MPLTEGNSGTARHVGVNERRTPKRDDNEPVKQIFVVGNGKKKKHDFAIYQIHYLADRILEFVMLAFVYYKPEKLCQQQNTYNPPQCHAKIIIIIKALTRVL